ncbi:MAG: sigma-54-dependent Fis family transcriptional regulator [Spirochaetes bacterium]|nr:sigma-54-dependent Fis family transcriptional regulator [Spirochaetota bacterium]
MFSILVVDDEKLIRDLLRDYLAKNGFKVDTAVDGIDALAKYESNGYDLVITDLNMPELDGIGLLKQLKAVSPDISVIVITAYGTIESAIDVVKEGASDYVLKPFILEEVLIKIQKAFNIKTLSKENVALKTELNKTFNFKNIIGKSRKIKDLLSLIKKVSLVRSNILITGESGTGKEIVARAIHVNSGNKNGLFTAINCGAIPENLLESELFGYKKGAFTGAYKNKEGLFITASNGTIFLDEIGNMPMSLQVKILRALETREVQPIGSNEFLPFNARIIAATNSNLALAIDHGTFREDLYYRLNVIEIKLPPLRERLEDIPLLVRYFIEKKYKGINKLVKGVTPETMELLCIYDWKGNIRELENIIERCIVLSDTERIGAECLPSFVKNPKSRNFPKFDRNIKIQLLKDATREFEHDYITYVLNHFDNDKKAVANVLGVSLASIYRRLEEETPQDNKK